MKRKSSLFLLIILLMALPFFCRADNAVKPTYRRVRKPAVRGQFYPATSTGVENLVKSYLAKTKKVIKSKEKIRAIIVPHAGYRYSGAVAAWSYKQVEGRHYKRVILIGSSHSVGNHIVSVNDVDAYESPLGLVPVDKDFVRDLKKSSEYITTDTAAHTREHSLEVQIPILQTVLKDFKIVPVIIEYPSPDLARLLAAKLDELDKGDETLYVFSTDLSHYPTYKVARKVDKESLKILQSMDIQKLMEHTLKVENRLTGEVSTSMCGKGAIFTSLYLAGIKKWKNPELLKYANSGDVSDNKSRVVGYSSLVFLQSKESAEMPPLNRKQEKKLLKLARKTISYYFNKRKLYPFKTTDSTLIAPGAVFVTLKKHGNLRGCIGIMQAIQPLYRSVQENALKSAFGDRRFRPLREEELKECEIEISMLTPFKKVKGYKDIVIGKHGVMIEKNGKHAVFLPQVAPEYGWSVEETLTQLCRKAGLEPDDWVDGMTFYTFTAHVFAEETESPETQTKRRSTRQLWEHRR